MCILARNKIRRLSRLISGALVSATADSSCGELSEAKHPAISTDSEQLVLPGNGTGDLSSLNADLIEVAGFFASLRMTL